MPTDPKIFKAYDIRGIYPQELDEDTAYKVGRVFVMETGAQKVIVGRDIRLSGPVLHQELVRGLTESGADVIDIGLVSVDMFYYACGAQNLPGIMVTASHNPKEYNGFKLVKKMPDLASGESMREPVLAGNFPLASKYGIVSKLDIKEDYGQKILSLIDASKLQKIKVVADPANGMAGPAFDLIYKDLPIDVVRLYFEPDGNFPNHGGDPLLDENTRDLEAMVIKEKADLGFAFDTDGDRFFAVDERGAKVPADFLTALFGRYLIEKREHGKIVYDCRSSWAVKDLAAEAGGEAVESRVGHRFIKSKMGEVGAIYGGEVSGHYYFTDFYFAESAVGTSLLLLEMLGHYQKTLAEMVAPLRAKYFGSGEINSKVPDADAILAKIKEKYQTNHRLYYLDGVSIVGENWWTNIRKSNTEPLLRLKVESIGDQKLMEQKRDELLAMIRG